MGLEFESLAGKTSLNSQLGVKADVDPNTCGKSDASDTISWVLGGRSDEVARGGEMIEFILLFRGTVQTALQAILARRGSDKLAWLREHCAPVSL